MTFRYAHAKIQTWVLVLCGPTHYHWTMEWEPMETIPTNSGMSPIQTQYLELSSAVLQQLHH